MILYTANPSPFSRMARVVARELNLTNRVEERQVNPWNDPDGLLSANPLGTIPTLILDDGGVLSDSKLITVYLNDQAGGTLFGTDEQRWAVGNRVYLADGILNAGVFLTVSRRRPEEERSPWWMERRSLTIQRTLQVLEREVPALQDPLTMDQIAVGCALGYLDFRQCVGDWRAIAPTLGAWFGGYAQRPAMVGTAPAD